MAGDYFAECSWQATVPPGDSLYPPGYRDPEYDGTEAGFAETVLPARAEALADGLNERFADVLPEGMRFEWVTEEER